MNHPNIPKPLHGIAPRVLKSQQWWDSKRREAYGRHGYCCHACGIYADYDLDRQRFVDIKLHAHECYDIDYENKTMELLEIVALCGDLCHNYVHSGRVQALYKKKVFDEQDCWTIFTHGDSVLIDNNFVPNTVDGRDYSEGWNDWRLIIDGVKHKPLRTEEEWRKHYGC